MAAELSMNQIIHAAVRRDLARSAAALRGLTDGDRERAGEIRRAWSFLVRELKHHHEGEDTHIWPYLRGQGVDDALLAAMEAEHAEMGEALRAGQHAIDAVATEPSVARATEAAAVIDRTAAVVARHLEHEEREVDPLIRRHRGEPGFKLAEKKVRHTRLSDAGSFLVWVQDGASAEEVAALRATIPGPVVTAVGVVFGRGYRTGPGRAWRS